MINYNCYIVDDEPDSIEILRDYIEQTPGLRVASSATDPRQIFSVITHSEKPQITFLDIEMPGMNGLELATVISAHTAIIFITSHTEHALEAFEKGAYDYLIKPVSYTRFMKAVIKVQTRIQDGLQTKATGDKSFLIRIPMNEEYKSIRYDEVLYLESMENYVIVHTAANEKHITYLTLKEFQYKLNRDNFFKVHKSFVVNLDRISGLKGNQLTMANSKAVPVGPTYRSGLLERLNGKTFTSDRRRKDGD